MAERVTVETREYEHSHVKAPRGRGGWVFAFDVSGGTESDYWFAPSGTYAEAKKAAVAEARQRGADSV